MPSFHTKTIESILDPVAQQVSRLVILHEEAEDGSAMPDLTKPVLAVKMAVDNLVKVGHETVKGSADVKFKDDMPPCLTKVEEAASFLMNAAEMLKVDPYSAPARKTLIDGSRGILQGTSSLLLVFDESEVRKIVQVCRSVLEYINITEVLESMEDLVTFVKSVSPVLTRMTREVDAREKELTHQKHRDWLQRSLEQVKLLTPILISSIKMFVHARQQELSETTPTSNSSMLAGDAKENRNAVVKKLTDEILEIIRVLQLTTQDEDELDSVTVMKRAQNALQSKLQAAVDWLLNPEATPENSPAGHKALLGILDDALHAAEQASPAHKAAIGKAVSDVRSMVAALEELKSNGQGDTAQAHALASGIKQRIADLQSLIAAAVAEAEQVSGSAAARHAAAAEARTLDDKVEVARAWLADVVAGSPAASHGRAQGEAALFAVVAEARRVAELASPGRQREELVKQGSDVDTLACQLRDLWCKGLGTNPQAKAIAGAIAEKLDDLTESVQQALSRQVADSFLDTATPLKQLCEAAAVPSGVPFREENLAEKADLFKHQSQKLVQTARLVAAVGGVASGDSRHAAEEMVAIAKQVESMTPRVVSAARIVLHSGGSGAGTPASSAAVEHLDLVKQQWTDDVQKLRTLVDDAVDTAAFIRATENAIAEDAERVEAGVRSLDAHQVVGGAASIARRANRVLQVAQRECENSEDTNFVQQVELATDRLKTTIPATVVGAKALAGDMKAPHVLQAWRGQNDQLVSALRDVRQAVTPPAPPPPPLAPPLPVASAGTPPDVSRLTLSSQVSEPSFLSTLTVGSLKADETAKKVQQQLGGAGLSATSPPGPLPPPVSPRSSVPYDGGAPPRPPPPTVDQDAEMERVFRQQPHESQPIMVAAHDLHQEMKLWESRDNDLVAAAKRMALLMAKLSELVRGDGGSKKELIDTAKHIAEASTEVTRLAKMLAAECTDKRMRINLLQVCERIPTIGTQLKILSTVKATMLGAQGSEEDEEATEMLVGNAQNLMQSVRDTIRVAEAASIRMRVDSGYTVAWIRRRPWYAQ